MKSENGQTIANDSQSRITRDPKCARNDDREFTVLHGDFLKAVPVRLITSRSSSSSSGVNGRKSAIRASATYPVGTLVLCDERSDWMAFPFASTTIASLLGNDLHSASQVSCGRLFHASWSFSTACSPVVIFSQLSAPLRIP
jgi:hypothetical protein